MILYIQISDENIIFGSLDQAAVVWKKSKTTDKDAFPSLSEAIAELNIIKPDETRTRSMLPNC